MTLRMEKLTYARWPAKAAEEWYKVAISNGV